MGLAAYGEPMYDLTDLLRVTSGGYAVDGATIIGRRSGDISRMERRFGPRRNPEVRITDDDRNLAASAQAAIEAALFALVAEGVRLTDCRRVCLAGWRGAEVQGKRPTDGYRRGRRDLRAAGR